MGAGAAVEGTCELKEIKVSVRSSLFPEFLSYKSTGRWRFVLFIEIEAQSSQVKQCQSAGYMV